MRSKLTITVVATGGPDSKREVQITGTGCRCCMELSIASSLIGDPIFNDLIIRALVLEKKIRNGEPIDYGACSSNEGGSMVIPFFGEN